MLQNSGFFFSINFITSYFDKIFFLLGEEMCNPNIVVFGQCKAHETCVSNNDTSGICQCKTDFVRSGDGLCQPVPQDPTPSILPDFSKSDSGGFGKKKISISFYKFAQILVLMLFVLRF